MPSQQRLIANQQAFRDDLMLLIQRAVQRGRRLTLGTIVGSVRTKQIPENPIAGQTVRVTFVAHVKLKEFEGQPIMNDVLVANQAHQLVTGSDSDGMPVTIELSASGTGTIVGRAALSNTQQTVRFSPIHDLDGLDLSFVYGLRVKLTADLGATLLARINDWRADNGRTPFTGAPGEIYLEDPQLDFHGQEYYQGYLSPSDGNRFLDALAGISCTVQTVAFDPFAGATPLSEKIDWWENGIATGFEGQDPWGAKNSRLVCTSIP